MSCKLKIQDYESFFKNQFRKIIQIMIMDSILYMIQLENFCTELLNINKHDMLLYDKNVKKKEIRLLFNFYFSKKQQIAREILFKTSLKNLSKL